MATNPTPDDDGMVVALAEDLADGCHLHETPLGIKQNTEAAIRATITGVTDAKRALGAANDLVDQRYDTLQSADAAGETLLRNCRLRLVKVLGGKYSSAWGEAGFPNQSTAVPNNQDKRFTLLASLKAYFTAHPAAASADMDATAANCDAAHEAISNARLGVNTAESAQTNAAKAEVDAVKTLRKRVRGLINELGMLMADDDARYEDFGLTVPANPKAPEAIASLTLTALGGAKAFAKWPYSRRMSGTRLKLKRVGVDDDFVGIGTVDGLEKLFTDLTVGQTIQLQAIAYNDGGDAPASPVATVLVT